MFPIQEQGLMNFLNVPSRLQAHYYTCLDLKEGKTSHVLLVVGHHDAYWKKLTQT